jgi:hypothetical protein
MLLAPEGSAEPLSGDATASGGARRDGGVNEMFFCASDAGSGAPRPKKEEPFEDSKSVPSSGSDSGERAKRAPLRRLCPSTFRTSSLRTPPAHGRTRLPEPP